MKRKELAEKTYKELFDKEIYQNIYDPEFDEITNYVIYGEMYHYGVLDNRRRELITIVILATLQTISQFKEHVEAALNIKVDPLEIREAIYQSGPFIGIARVQNVLDAMNEVFINRGIKLPLKRIVQNYDDNNRYEIGLKHQFPIYGDNVKNRYSNIYEGYSEFVPRILTEYAFGDFYRRGILDVKDRELLTLCILITLNSYQVAPHIIGNLKVGNTKEEILCAIVHCQPYIGTPSSYQALNMFQEVISKNNI